MQPLRLNLLHFSIRETLLFVLTGIAGPSWTLAVTAVPVTGGTLIAARASLKSYEDRR